MNQSSPHAAQWSTASFGISADTSPMELETLQAHLSVCKKPLDIRFILQCSAHDAYSFLTTRIISTLLVVALLLSVLIRVW